MKSVKAPILSCLMIAAFGVAAYSDITIMNLRDGEILRYPVALIKGNGAGGSIRVADLDNNHPDGTNSVTCVNGVFKILVELVPGKNHLALTSGMQTKDIVLQYKPMTTVRRIVVIYLTAADGKTEYRSQKKNDPQNYKQKLDTAAKLLQTFTAERLDDLGMGRTTFNLEFDGNGRVVVHTLTYPEKLSDLVKMRPDALFAALYKWIRPQFPMECNKCLVVMAFSYYDPRTGRSFADSGLGGGGLALAGSGGMCAWPDNMRDVDRAFADCTPIDTNAVRNDSGSRGVLWAMASTTIGAALHELGHTFDLRHAEDPLSIMSRGFDLFSREFTLTDAPWKDHPTPTAFADEAIACWDVGSAARLAAHPSAHSAAGGESRLGRS